MTPTEHTFQGPAGQLAVQRWGDARAPAVLMAHSILSSHRMWREQAALLASQGWQVLCADTRGHGGSQAPAGPYTMDQLAADSVAVLDALAIAKAHYVGLSLGGMSGFGVALNHAERLLSLVVCDARADMPAAAGAVWNERIDLALAQKSCAGLAAATLERWFGAAFVAAHPDTMADFTRAIAATSPEGFAGCARAIQGLNYLPRCNEIKLPTTFIVGANDGPLPQALRDLTAVMPQARLEVIADAMHLPNIDQPEAFNQTLLRHFASFR